MVVVDTKVAVKRIVKPNPFDMVSTDATSVLGNQMLEVFRGVGNLLEPIKVADAMVASPSRSTNRPMGRVAN